MDRPTVVERGIVRELTIKQRDDNGSIGRETARMVEPAPDKRPTAQVIFVNGDWAVKPAIADHHLRSRVAHETVDGIAYAEAVEHPASAIQTSLYGVSGRSPVDRHVSNPGLLGTRPVNGVVASGIVGADLYVEVFKVYIEDIVAV